MNSIEEILNEMKSEKLEKEEHAKKIELGRKDALAKIETLTKQADAALAEAARLAEEYKIEFGWYTPNDSHLTYKPEKEEGYEESDEYYGNQVGWTSSSDYC